MRPSPAHPFTPEQRLKLDQLAGLVRGLPRDRREALGAWLEEEARRAAPAQPEEGL